MKYSGPANKHRQRYMQNISMLCQPTAPHLQYKFSVKFPLRFSLDVKDL